MDAATLGTLAQWAGVAAAIIIAIYGAARSDNKGEIAALSRKLDAAEKKAEEQQAKAFAAIDHDIGRVFERVDADGQRITRIEGELRHMPSKDDVANLKVAVAEIKGDVKALGAIAHAVARIEAVLMKDENK